MRLRACFSTQEKCRQTHADLQVGDDQRQRWNESSQSRQELKPAKNEECQEDAGKECRIAEELSTLCALTAAHVGTFVCAPESTCTKTDVHKHNVQIPLPDAYAHGCANACAHVYAQVHTDACTHVHTQVYATACMYFRTKAYSVSVHMPTHKSTCTSSTRPCTHCKETLSSHLPWRARVLAGVQACRRAVLQAGGRADAHKRASACLRSLSEVCDSSEGRAGSQEPQATHPGSAHLRVA